MVKPLILPDQHRNYPRQQKNQNDRASNRFEVKTIKPAPKGTVRFSSLDKTWSNSTDPIARATRTEITVTVRL